MILMNIYLNLEFPDKCTSSNEKEKKCSVLVLPISHTRALIHMHLTKNIVLLKSLFIHFPNE